MTRIEPGGVVRLQGIVGGKNASAVALFGQQLLIVADEITNNQNVVQIFNPDGEDFTAAPGGPIILDAGGAVEEMDLEGIAVNGQDVFVLGSHSRKRKKVEADKKYAKNRERLLAPPVTEAARDVLLHFKLDAEGHAGPIERTSLRGFLAANEPFKSCGAMASKENGIDAEGLAIFKQRLYVGFRGPVLRGNFAPILRCRFGSPIIEPEILFVDLGGRGVRDLAHTADGLLILAGPVGDGPGSFQLYLWDGRDMVPGTDAPTSPADPGLRLLGDLPLPMSNTGVPQISAKAEGLALVQEQANHWDILVVYDGLDDGHATSFRVDKVT